MLNKRWSGLAVLSTGSELTHEMDLKPWFEISLQEKREKLIFNQTYLKVKTFLLTGYYFKSHRI